MHALEEGLWLAAHAHVHCACLNVLTPNWLCYRIARHAGHREETTRIMRDFQQKLRALSADVDVRNAGRSDFVCDSFNPAKMLTSVSI